MTEQYKNAIPSAMLLQELKKVQLHECLTIMTHDAIGHLKMLCMSISSLICGVESE